MAAKQGLVAAQCRVDRGVGERGDDRQHAADAEAARKARHRDAMADVRCRRLLERSVHTRTHSDREHRRARRACAAQQQGAHARSRHAFARSHARGDGSVGLAAQKPRRSQGTEGAETACSGRHDDGVDESLRLHRGGALSGAQAGRGLYVAQYATRRSRFGSERHRRLHDLGATRLVLDRGAEGHAAARAARSLLHLQWLLLRATGDRRQRARRRATAHRRVHRSGAVGESESGQGDRCAVEPADLWAARAAAVDQDV